ncbi:MULTISPECIES: hypothetical protein [Brucella/Ochrobactrum group]|uniref:Uncharacterized protein n=2 Tax=Ochrobactrum TaxID=528 RepID=A0A2P9HH77_9HYPH|nr:MULTISPECIES: hypothetical protein [Brucella]MCI1001284.1 hypothetical protein [Ochrobactrum sp. C6C9]RRD21779.1 hypothetical protein ECB98_22735 [Brucellaceae bacterium VT-16-1752]WHT43290.1 hypothetical protein QLQ11_15375 [Ochrobactrum sp. SSR]MDX4074911.1 hypothetical protein [Brucella sp. NBRC 113783]NNU59688.1 hypothetical protein [[Ochrobactrum] soli]
MKAIAIIAIGSMMVSGTALAAAPVVGAQKPAVATSKENGKPVLLAVGPTRNIGPGKIFGTKGA